MGEKTNPERKRPYVRPQVQEVLLSSEEAVLQACKLFSGVPGANKTNGRCNNPWLCLIDAS